MADRYFVVGGSNDWSDTARWSASPTLTPTGASVPTASDNVFFTSSATYTVTFPNVASYIANCLNFTASAGSPSFAASNLTTTFNINGNFDVSATTGGNIFTSQPAITFGPTSGAGGTLTINCGNRNFSGGGAVTFRWNSGVALLIYRLLSNFSITNTTNTVTLTRGELDLNGYTLNCGSFTAANANSKSITSGVGGTIVCNRLSGTPFTISGGATTITGDLLVQTTNSSSSTLTIVLSIVTNPISFLFTGSNYGLVFLDSANARVKDITFAGGYSGTWAGRTNAQNVSGNITLSPGMTYGASTGTLSLTGSSGTQTITTNGRTWDGPLNINTTGATVQLAGALTMGATRVLTWTNGTFDGGGYTISGSGGVSKVTNNVIGLNINTSNAFTHTSGNLTLGANSSFATYALASGTLDLAGYVLSTTAFATSAGTKNLTFNGGTISSSGTTNAFANLNPTGFTTTAGIGTGKISLTSASAKNFVGGNSTYNCNLSNDGAGAVTISGNNAFLSILNGVQPTTFTFTSGTTQTVGSSFGLAGTAGNLVTLNTTTSGTRATIARSFDTTSAISFDSYLSIKDISFSPLPAANGSTPYVWYFGTTNTNAGNNDGAAFTDLTNIIYRITTTGAGTWTVPSNWNSANNDVYLIGGGGGGRAGQATRQGGSGGGGGGFTLVQNFSTTPASSISVSVGAGGAAGFTGSPSGTSGSATTWDAGTYSAGGGTGATSNTVGGAGGIGSTYNGGTGGTSGSGPSSGTGSAAGGGGGGAGGPLGAGATGGNGTFGAFVTSAGGGGGGNGGGSAGATPAGGNNASGIGGGATYGNPGSFGGGGAGGGIGVFSGGAASIGIDILNTSGSGSGGAAGGGNSTSAGDGTAGGLYGGGGAGGGVTNGGAATRAAAGAQGVIFIVYSPAGNTGNFFFMF